MKNEKLLKPTEGQKKYRNRLWAEALQKNKKKATGSMYDCGGRCCLAVAQDVAIKNGVTIEKNYSDGEQPHPLVGVFFGWGEKIPRMFFPKEEKLCSTSAIDLNDESEFSANGSNGMSHKRIAECVLNTFVHPSKKKWSFIVKD